MKIHTLLLLLLVGLSPLKAQDTPSTPNAAAPSDASIEELLQLSGSEKLLTSLQAQMKAMFTKSMDASGDLSKLSPEQKAAVENMKTKMGDVFTEELSWPSMKALYTEVYKESFNQDEINMLIEFYKSPTGEMFVQKMPVVMQKTMALTQQHMATMMAKMKALREEMMAEMKKAAPTPTPKNP